jgi:hypothetical protein
MASHLRCLRNRSRIALPVLFLLAPCAAQTAASPEPALAITGFTFREYEGGRVSPPGRIIQPGDFVWFDFLVNGFKKAETDFDDKIHIEYRLMALDSGGRLLAPELTGRQQLDVAPEDKNWRPKVQGSFPVPLYLAPGTYRIRAVVHDVLAKAERQADFPFEVGGSRAEPSTEIVARNFRFSRAEEDSAPLPVAAFRPGDTVWGRFEMTGFQLSPQGETAIQYGLRVLNTAGKLLFENAVAAEEKKKFFYPPAYLPGVISLTTQPGTPNGEYSITLTVRDLVSGKSAESSHPFRLEQ